MSKAFARQTKLSNIGGRSDYISNPTRQENIVLHSTEFMQNEWKDYSDFERQNKKSVGDNVEGREIIIHLPHELSYNKDELKEIMDKYCQKTLGNNRDFEYAVHWNKDKTNLHAHILFSERERNLEREPKTYKKNIWINKETGKLAKANSENAELRFKVGDIQYDKTTGEIKYNDDPFTTKDRHFKTKEFNEQIKQNQVDILNEHNFEYRMHDPKKEIAQVHKGHVEKRKPETYERLEKYNNNVISMNEYLNKMKMTVKEYLDKFKNLFNHYQKPRIDTRELELQQKINELENQLKELKSDLVKPEKDINAYDKALNKLRNLDTKQRYVKNKKVGLLDFKGQEAKRSELQSISKQIDSLDKKLDNSRPRYNESTKLSDKIRKEITVLERKIEGGKQGLENYRHTNKIRVAKQERIKGFSVEELAKYQKAVDDKKQAQQERDKTYGKSRGR